MQDDRLPAEQMAAIQPHKDWDDGRTGFEWCRFDALLDPVRLLRAEVTWDESGGDSSRMYCDPRLLLESNRPDYQDDRLVTLDSVTLELDVEEAVRIVEANPRDLLTRYAEHIALLTCWRPDVAAMTQQIETMAQQIETLRAERNRLHRIAVVPASETIAEVEHLEPGRTAADCQVIDAWNRARAREVAIEKLKYLRDRYREAVAACEAAADLLDTYSWSPVEARCREIADQAQAVLDWYPSRSEDPCPKT